MTNEKEVRFYINKNKIECVSKYKIILRTNDLIQKQNKQRNK